MTLAQHMVRSLSRPAQLFGNYQAQNLRPDLTAGLTVAVILLPQAIAFALIVDLPPEMGIYAAVVAAIAGGLWGSCNQVHTGPTNALSILVLSALTSSNLPDHESFIVAAGLMAVMVGVFQLFMGLAGLGLLVNFVSHSVIVGFAGGAGVLIAIKQLRHLAGLDTAGESTLQTLIATVTHLTESHLPTLLIGAGTIALILLTRWIDSRLPGALIAMAGASTAVFMLQLHDQGVAVLGSLPRQLPPLASLPLLDLDLMRQLSVGALAVGAIGLVETSAIARSIAAQTGQRLNSNQEFVGQGLANMAAGFFTGFPCAGSFSRSAVNFKAGAKTRMSSLFSALFVLLSLFLLAPVAAFLPRTALAAVLIVTAFGMIDYAEIRRIFQGTPEDAFILAATFLGTIFLHIEFAVLAGILLSFGFYILKTSVPKVESVLPDNRFKHFAPQLAKPSCPQLGVIEIQGDIYFGAVSHVEKAIRKHQDKNPEQRFLLLRLKGVNQCDFSGIHALEIIVRLYRDRGGDVFLTRVPRHVLRFMIRTGFHRHLGRDHFLFRENAVAYLFHRVLDPAICIYECPVRAFRECQNLPKPDFTTELPMLPTEEDRLIPRISPRDLWQKLHGDFPPRMIDVREAREYRLGHVPESELIPLPTLLSAPVTIASDETVVLICRSGRRSARAAAFLSKQGRVSILKGGMLAWQDANLLEATGDEF